jgi:phosphoglycolate phosphatase
MTKIQPLLVFDLDGTLIDTAADLTATLNVILAAEGIAPLGLEVARPMMGLGARRLIERGFHAQGVPLPEARREDLFVQYLRHYEAHIADHSLPYPGVVDALDRFADAGWQLAICTNKIEHAARKLMTSLGLAERFAVIAGQDTYFDGARAISKPDPRVLLRTIEAAGGQVQTSIMVGDSKTDISTARAADVPVVAVDFGYTDRPIAEYAPDIVISHFDELWSAVSRLSASRSG